MQQSIFQFKEKPDFNCRCEPLKRVMGINQSSITCLSREGDACKRVAGIIRRKLEYIYTVVLVQRKQNRNFLKRENF